MVDLMQYFPRLLRFWC